MGPRFHLLVFAVLLAVVAACGSNDATGDDAGGDAAAASEGSSGEVSGVGSEALDHWIEEEPADLLPVPDTLRISRQGWGSGSPFFAARDEETPKDEVLADVEFLMDELGWQDVERSEDGAWTRFQAEHDDWTVDFSVTSIRDDEGTMMEGGMAPR